MRVNKSYVDREAVPNVWFADWEGATTKLSSSSKNDSRPGCCWPQLTALGSTDAECDRLQWSGQHNSNWPTSTNSFAKKIGMGSIANDSVDMVSLSTDRQHSDSVDNDRSALKVAAIICDDTNSCSSRRNKIKQKWVSSSEPLPLIGLSTN